MDKKSLSPNFKTVALLYIVLIGGSFGILRAMAMPADIWRDKCFWRRRYRRLFDRERLPNTG